MKIPTKIYKQTLPCTVFSIVYPAIACGDKMLKYFENGYDGIICLFEGSLMTNHMNEENMKKCAEEFLAKKEMPQQWQEELQTCEKEIERISKELHKINIKKLSDEELTQYFKEIDLWTIRMWTVSIFIDSLDPGYDIQEIKNICLKYKLSKKEADLLLTPRKKPYYSAFEEEIKKLHEGSITKKDIIKQFYWLKTTYEKYQEFTIEQLSEITKNNKGKKWDDPSEKQEELLKQKKLNNNPLEQLRITTEWRDDRKKLCYMGLHAFYTILREAFTRSKVDEELSHWLGSPKEALEAIKGHIDVEKLQKRKEKTIITCQGNDVILAIEEEAEKIEKQLKAAEQQNHEEISGMVASKGKAQGKVRIVRRTSHAFVDGDILVTSMTRPEHVPLMRKAAAIVTDEGGITSHAAIVSRELGIPCVIGTKIATSVLKEGDMVEVNADHGLVRKI